MKKLNDKGWGLSKFIMFLVIFLIAIMIITITVKNNYNVIKVNSNNDEVQTIEETNTHNQIEKALDLATTKYVTGGNLYIKIEESKIVTIKTLLSKGLVTTITDSENNKCTGYTKVTRTTTKYLYKSYIKCSDSYETSGYIAENDENY